MIVTVGSQRSPEDLRRLPLRAEPTSVTTWSTEHPFAVAQVVTLATWAVEVGLLVGRADTGVDGGPASESRTIAGEIPEHDEPAHPLTIPEAVAGSRTSRASLPQAGTSASTGTVVVPMTRMTQPDAGIPCVYCGTRHPRAIDVRRCWERSAVLQRAQSGSASLDRLAPPARSASLDRPAALDRPVSLDRPAPAARAPVTGATPAAVALLGRSVIVAPGQAVPAGWERCERSTGSLDELEQAWRDRTPLVIELDDQDAERGEDGDGEAGEEAEERRGQARDEVERRPVWSLAPSFAFAGERRAHATFANAIDARGGRLRWRLADEAVRLGAAAGGPADVVLPDGTPALCDGGPLEWRDRVGTAAVLPRLSVLAGSLVPFGTNETDAVLARDQLAAVVHAGGSARVIAPAGSGKTRVLTERARHVLRRWGLPGHAVTLVAFNKRAADEMRERTPDLPELQVRTLNALGLSLVVRSERVTTIDEHEVRSILDTLVDLPRRAHTDPAAAWIEALSAVRLGLRPPAEVEAELGGDVDGLPEVFERYRSVLAARRVVDFDEQVYRAIEVLLTDPAARRAARASCRMLLVDEFQDLTPAHLLLLRLLAGPDGAMYAVGDDDQTIYGYSGASPEWLIEFRRYFPTAGNYALEVNYRCPAPVVEAARTLLTHNRRRVAKRIVAVTRKDASRQDTSRDGIPTQGTPTQGTPTPSTPSPSTPSQKKAGAIGGELEVTAGVGAIAGELEVTAGAGAIGGELEVTAGEEALDETVDYVADLVARGTAPADVAVLTRVNASLAPVQVALAHRRVPFRRAVDLTYLARSGVQAALAWLRLAACAPNRLAPADVALAARRPSRALSPKVVEWMAEQGEQDGLAGLRRLAGRLQARDGEKIAGFVSDLETLRRRASSGTTADVLRAVRDVVGLDRAMELLESGRRRVDRSAQTDDLDALVALAALHPEPEGFEAWLRQSLSLPGSTDGVTLSTIHRVKGREWPHVVLHEVSTGLLPHRLASDVEEERRLFHVGLTRCSASVRVVGGLLPSPFLAELRAPRRPSSSSGSSSGSPSSGEHRAGSDPSAPTRTPHPSHKSQKSRERNESKERNESRAGEEKDVPPLVATLGATFERHGHRQQITAIDDEGVETSVGRATMHVPYGELVSVEGRLRRLVRQPPPAEVAERARRALREWRSARAKAERKPPYVFLHDRTLEAIVAAMPSSTRALARVEGIGPVKLEAYGEELLALLAAARVAGRTAVS